MITDKVLENLHRFYDLEYDNFHKNALSAPTEGAIRYAAGDFVEQLLQNIIDSINEYIPDAKIKSIVGSHDFLSKEINYKGELIQFTQIQVDRHLWSKGRRIAFIENKTYLDSCYYDRALADFKKIIQALEQKHVEPSSVKYIVFAGQNAAKDETLLTYEADFWHETLHYTKNKDGIVPQIFFFLKEKRCPSKPWYKIKYELNDKAVKEFVECLISLID